MYSSGHLKKVCRCNSSGQVRDIRRCNSPGPGCSKLTMSLVNVSLKFVTFLSEIRQYVFVEKMSEVFAVQKLLTVFQHMYQCVWL